MTTVACAVQFSVMTTHLNHTAGLRQFRLALVQLAVGADKAANLQRASQKVKEAAENGAKVVALPVSTCFNILECVCTSIV